MVRLVAIVCGAGGEMLSDATRARADVFLTGEMRFHDYLRSQAEGVGLLLPGHHATERPGFEMPARKLAEEWPGVACTAAEAEREPVGYV